MTEPSLGRPPESFPFGQRIAWQPRPEWIEASNLRGFMDRHGIPSYEALLERSTADVAWFWDAVLRDLDILFDVPYRAVMELPEGPQFPAWCVGGRLNIVRSCLDKWVERDATERIALRWEGEEGLAHMLTYGELCDEVGRCTNALRALGLRPGEAVGLFMPMTPELVVAFLAVIRAGGVVLPLFSGYGPSALATRLEDAGAAMVFTATGFWRRGQPVRLKPVLDEALEAVPGVRRVIVHDRLGAADETPWRDGRDVWWHEWIAGHPAEATPEPTAAEDPLMLIYTSGTTGRPKGAVHTHCGFPVKAAQDLSHAMDLKPTDTLYWMTDMGWMMGPWEVFGALLVGATLVLYDGAPDFPEADRVWQLVERHGVTHLGVSPTLVRALRPHGAEPVERHDVSTLRAVCSTGSPWDPESWRWLFETVLRGEKPILNYSGGTEISGGILCGNFFTPLKPCAFSGPVPGMDADVVDDAGRPVRGRVGELVIRQPWIGMTRGFWRDRQRYLDTYWSRFEGVWVHGDFAAVDEDGLWYILGRSDDTIKVAGKRLGPAEVEAVLNAHPAVAESAAVGVPDEVKGQEVVAFCVLRAGFEPGEELREALRARVAEELGKPLRPRTVRFAAALPRTRNAKPMHRVIRAAYLGQDPGDLSSLEDPAAVEAIREAR